MNQWEIYSMLKGCKLEEMTQEEIADRVNKTPYEELKEGIIEYLYCKQREPWTN
jgi:hypothetical protein